MRLNNNIFANYFAALNNHIVDTKTFHNKTELFSTCEAMHSLHAEDLAYQVAKGSTLGKELTRAEKILTILKEIALGNELYQDKLSQLMPILGSIISTVNFAK